MSAALHVAALVLVALLIVRPFALLRARRARRRLTALLFTGDGRVSELVVRNPPPAVLIGGRPAMAFRLIEVGRGTAMYWCECSAEPGRRSMAPTPPVVGASPGSAERSLTSPQGELGRVAEESASAASVAEKVPDARTSDLT